MLYPSYNIRENRRCTTRKGYHKLLTSNAICAVQNRLMVASRSLGKTFGRLTHRIQNFTVHTNDKSKLRITPHDVTAGHCKSDLFQFTRYTVSSFLELRRLGYLPKESNMFKNRNILVLGTNADVTSVCYRESAWIWSWP